jgi:S1-C subfamily serine protease
VAGVYGEPLLSRFNATYDYARKTVWLEPLPQVGPLPPNRAGLSVARKTAGGPLAVSSVAEGSPAAEAGLKLGDVVRSVNGQAAETLARADVQALFLEAPGARVTLEVGSDTPRRVQLTLRDPAAP